MQAVKRLGVSHLHCPLQARTIGAGPFILLGSTWHAVLQFEFGPGRNPYRVWPKPSWLSGKTVPPNTADAQWPDRVFNPILRAGPMPHVIEARTDAISGPGASLVATPEIPRDSVSSGRIWESLFVVEDHSHERVWPALAAIAALFVALTWITWAHWGDVRVDCGREMYVSDAISQGRMLYRDLWHGYPPLAPYAVALAFLVFGSHLTVLYGFGLAITLAFAVTLFGLSRRFLSNEAALLVSLAFLLQAFQPGLFNYILPHAPAATLGSLLALSFLYYLVRHLRGERGPNLWAAGTAAGLALVCKQEFGPFCYLTVAAVAGLQVAAARSVGVIRPMLLPFLPGLGVAAAVYGWFAWRLSPSVIFVDNMHTPFSYLVRTIGTRWVAQQGLHTDPVQAFTTLVSAVGALSLWFLLARSLARLLARYGMLRLLALGSLVSIAGIAAMGWLRAAVGLIVLVPLLWFPVGMGWMGLASVAAAILRWRRGGHQRQDLAVAAVCIYAVAAGTRIIFLVAPAGYAIYYNAGLYVVFLMILARVVTLAASVLPAAKRATLTRALLALEGVGLAAALWVLTDRPPARLDTPRGTIYTGRAEAEAFPKILSFIEQQRAAGQKVLILPEETSLYYFSGTHSPTRWYALTPGVLGPENREREYIAQLEAQGVNYILLSNRSTKEYGLPFFGLDYNQTVYRWIEANFEVVGEFGRFSRKKPEEFGMLVYRRR